MFSKLVVLVQDVKLGTAKVKGADTPVLNNRVAIHHGKDIQDTIIPCVAWRKTAEIIAGRCKKGDQVEVAGEIWDKESSLRAKDGTMIPYRQPYLLIDSVSFVFDKKDKTG
jgi:hypothetical protein